MTTQLSDIQGEVLSDELDKIFDKNQLTGEDISVTEGIEAEALLPKDDWLVDTGVEQKKTLSKERKEPNREQEPTKPISTTSFPAQNSGILKEDYLGMTTMDGDKFGEVASLKSQAKEDSIKYDRREFQDGLNFQSIVSVLRSFFFRYKSAPFFHTRLVILGVLLICPLILPAFLSGVFWGLYLAVITYFYVCVTEAEQPDKEKEAAVKRAHALLNNATTNVDANSNPVYKGWINILEEPYNPRTFHINQAETVLATLDGHMLYIAHPETKVTRNTTQNDPTLNEEPPNIKTTEVFDLTKAKIKLRPARLSSRRWFSRKYPILIKLAQLERSQLSGQGEAWSLPAALDELDTEQKICQECDGTEEDDDWEAESIAAPDLQTSRRGKCTNKHRTICLFTRGSREKEHWFHKLRMASQEYAYPYDINQFPIVMPLLEGNGKMPKEYYLYMLQRMEFNTQLTIIRNEAIGFNQQTTGIIPMDLGLYTDWDKKAEEEAGPIFIAVVNLLTARIFYDFCRDDTWVGMIYEKVKNKMQAVHMPNFIESLQLSKFDLGTSAPQVTKFYAPYVDQWGTWVDYEIDFHGKLSLTIETQVNLEKLTEEDSSGGETHTTYFHQPVRNPALAVPDTNYEDEELPLSPEDEPDDDDCGKKNDHQKEQEAAKKKPGRKILNLVDKITHSSLFKGASDFKLVKMAMEKISDTKLIMNVEISALSGRMTINLAHPPSDRLWYGFRETPNISIKATPQVGDQAIAFPAISDWIEGIVVTLMQKFVVFPNLDDLVVPFFKGNELLRPSFTQ